ncbi:hypothetical protein FQR65_LT15112 [Abscondita terminalis]|nr:hypothetical protein FQR65_LT15112 [Abscondita terminalis]
MNLPGEPDNLTQREVFLHSLIDFDCKMSVYSIGALIKFMERNWSDFVPNEAQFNILNINKISLQNKVLIDRNTFNGLQVFEEPSQSLRYREPHGFSIFKLFSQHCKSNIGYFCLRNLLRNPIKDVGELKKRLDFIEFAIIPSNQGFIEGLQNNIKKISNVNMILRKIYYRIANANDWERLYNIIFSILHVHELSLPYEQTSPLLSSLNAEITPKLYELQYFIYHALDFSQSNKENRPVIKFGLDDELDAKELKKQDIAKNATAAAQIAVNQLPDFLNECSVVYIPEMGHFVAVQKWEPNCDRNALGNHGFSFSFETNDCLHYKNSLCHELDKQLGNIYLDILAHQNRIIQRLSDLILKYSKDIEQPLKIIGMIDCFISISRVVKEKDYVRPELNENCIIEIVDGRHPLLELVNPNYVSNNFYSGDNHGRIQILTGPNDSGKSIFLKQTALIVYLAMVGCYVPAKKATIGIVHSIHTTTHCTESAAVNMSAFMIDLSKMSHSLLKAKPSSLVLIDEFGRGTSADDGISLLVSALKTFSSKEELCPHLLVSTHYQQISHFLPQSQLVSYKKMDHEIRDTGELIYLYKVVDGISNSYTFEVAIANGLDISIVNRAKEIYNMLTKNIPLTHPDNFNLSQTDLFDIKIPEPNN